MSVNWYVLHSKQNKEELLWEQLSIRKVKAYFPGYVFIHVDLEETGLSVLQWMPGATGFVSFDSSPSMVPEALIQAVKKKVDEINAAGGEIFDGLKQGDLVEIRSGCASC